MPQQTEWRVNYFDDTDMYEIRFETKTAYITVEIYDADNVEFNDEFGGSIVDNASQTTIRLFQHGNKGINVGCDSNEGGVSNVFIPLPEDMYNDIARYIERGVLEEHVYIPSSVVNNRTPSVNNRTSNIVVTDPENPNVANTGDPLAGGRRRKTTRRRKVAKKGRK